jgi:PhzF family phenazine biosynthesis protein
MTLSLYQIDAFTDTLFGGNPAAVIPLQHWIPDGLMQQIALENNLSETVFIVPLTGTQADYEIRWFTPRVEINLCGHATLASAYVLFNLLQFVKDTITFSSKSGLLKVTKKDDLLVLDFPSWKPERFNDYPEALAQILGGPEIIGVYKHRDILVELADEAAVKNCTPDFSLMKKHIDKMIITAPGKTADFVSRFFAPGAGVHEDPVTGSAHSQLIPFWSEKLGKTQMHALQLSERGGQLWCEQVNESRVAIAGKAVYYMKATIEV